MPINQRALNKNWSMFKSLISCRYGLKSQLETLETTHKTSLPKWQHNFAWWIAVLARIVVKRLIIYVNKFSAFLLTQWIIRDRSFWNFRQVAVEIKKKLKIGRKQDSLAVKSKIFVFYGWHYHLTQTSRALTHKVSLSKSSQNIRTCKLTVPKFDLANTYMQER